MAISHVPRGFTSVTPYFIVVNGGAFLEFVTKAFDALTIDEHREEGVLRHFACSIFGSMIEGSEANDRFPARPQSIHLYVTDCDEVFERAVAAGAATLYEVSDMPYGERSGGIEDPFGNHWYIATQTAEMYPLE